MARQAGAADQTHPIARATRAIRVSTVSAVWVAGLAAGWFSILAATARYGCAAARQGFGCGTPGSLTGVLLLLAVISIVTAVTLAGRYRSTRGMILLGGLAIGVLVGCLMAADAVIAAA